MIEVEVKLPLKDPKGMKYKLRKLGARLGAKEKQTDIYYNAPHRDFAKTDEALRIRIGKDTTLTYKGPKLDKVSKTRKELYTQIGDVDQAAEILRALDFKEVATVIKTRETYRLGDLNVSIDNVHDLGTFIEIEAMSGANYQSALDNVFQILDELGLKRENIIRESYLELILGC